VKPKVIFNFLTNVGYPLKKIIPYVYEKEGLKGFYKGYIPRIMKKAVSSGIFWSLYEKLN
jgi:solute carrier family 25 protein 38